MSGSARDPSRGVDTITEHPESPEGSGAPSAPASVSPPSSKSPRGDFARYRIDGEIGRGGMGAVFRVWDFDLARTVAMKVLHDFIEEDERFATRFLEEAQVAARLQHPAIVPVYDVGTNPKGKLYFTMKLVEGRTLSRVVKGRFAGDETTREYTRFRLIETFREICRAIAYVHERGIVHRDLKPNNVMLGQFGEVQIMDWGLAKVVDERSDTSLPRLLAERRAVAARSPASLPSIPSTSSLSSASRHETAAGTVMGTPAYMAPEQARGEGGVSPRWDVYALGGILHFILTGKAPEGAPTRRLAAEERAASMIPPRLIDATIPREIEAICLRALAPSPDARYPTALALASDVQAFLEQRPVSAFPEGPVRRAWKWARRRRRALAVVGVVLAATAGVDMAARASAGREALLQARTEARAAGETFATARAKIASSAGDSPALRAERDRILGLGMSALQAAQAVSALTPHDPAAKRASFDAAIALGEVALEDRQWGLAASAFERAQGTHADDVRAQQAILEVEHARTRVADEHAKTASAILDAALAGQLDRDADYQDALFALVAIGDDATVDALARGLGRVTAELRSARRAFLLEAQALTDDERRRGEAPIDGLEAAIDALLAAPPSAPPEDAKTTTALRRAGDRLVARAAALLPRGVSPPFFRTIMGVAEERSVGAHSLRLARLASEALGRIGIIAGAADSIEQYLATEDEELRAVPPAIALCLLARPSSEAVVGAARDRLGTSNGLFWKLVAPTMRRFHPDEKEDPTTADGFLARAKARGLRGDLEGAIADHTRAIELDPKLTSSWLARGVARRRAGDIDGAIADYTHAIGLDPNNPILWNDRGFAELEKDDVDDAIADLEHSLKLRPQSARTVTHRATAYRCKGRLDVALAGYEAALKIDPRFELAYRGRGEAHVDGNEAQAAIADYDHAIELDGHDAEAWAGRAIARLLAKDTDGALADASRAADLDPKSGLALLAQARVQRARGDVAGALDDARRALTLDLRARDAITARALVAQIERGR